MADNKSKPTGEAILFELFDQIKEQYSDYLLLAGNDKIPVPQVPIESEPPSWSHPLTLVIDEQ